MLRGMALHAQSGPLLHLDAPTLGAWLQAALALTHDLVADLDASPPEERLESVNCPRWEVGHVAWFYGRWFLREGRCESDTALGDEDAVFDSMRLVHADRWDAALPTVRSALDCLERVVERLVEGLEETIGDERCLRLLLLCLFHHEMHNEAFAYTRQTLAYPCTPALAERPRGLRGAAAEAEGTLALPGGSLTVGADDPRRFAFDNERPARRVTLAPFELAARPVTRGEFATFVEAGGYRDPALWDEAGRAWLLRTGAELPLYWRRVGPGRFEERWFERWVPLASELPMVHVGWHEARAYARFVGRRLPREHEWEQAARAYPELLLGTSVWEWTEDAFAPYPGFRTEAYPDYSAPWFGTRRVLRGASWLTPEHMRWPSLRNFCEPHRRDVWAGFRTALDRS